ncbi:MAG: hypothetical protein ABI681_01785 [Gemmatimonadales bacterium]
MPSPADEVDSERISARSLWLAMGAYVALVVTLALRHEMWRDEVRAFSVATKAGSWSALLTDLQYEGHPILWYAVLRLGYSVSHSNLVLPVAGLAAGAIAAYLLLRHAPFPVWLRMLAVFGAFLGYELSVVSRNYGIGVVLMICACIAFPSRRKRPLLLGFTLALLANTSVHAALASLVLLFLWLIDLFDAEERAPLLRISGVAAVALAVAGVAAAYWTAVPSPDMVWAFSPDRFQPGSVLRTIFTDPGLAMSGANAANIAAANELPWRVVGIDSGVASRVIVDICLAWLAWSLRRHRGALAALILTILGFEILFRHVYSGSLRHEGLVAFLFIAICWITITRGRTPESPPERRRIAMGLLPMLLAQTAALPVMAQRYIKYDESGSRAYGDFIKAHPRYRDAIIAGEPDYMMESMPYYVGNKVFMPRQREFAYRVHFDRGQRRIADLSMGQLIDIVDSVVCASRKPVLLAIAYRELLWQRQAEIPGAYKGMMFRWTEDERDRLMRRAPKVAAFPHSTTDEIYRVFEFAPGASTHCAP